MKHARRLFQVLLFPPTLFADEQDLIVRCSKVYNDAITRSALVAKIETGSIVNVMERKGGWKLIFSDEKSIIGWVRGHQSVLAIT